MSLSSGSIGPQQDLQVSVVQTSLVWHDPKANRANLGELVGRDCKGSDVVVLPEMFTAGFSMDSKQFAEPADGPTLEWMTALARDTGAVITGSYAVLEDTDNPEALPVNRLVWARPDGSFDYYDKRHLFRMAGEHNRYRSGEKRIVVELKGWRVCPLVCYDLRFPVWCRNRDDYDVLVFVANWPAARAEHWSQLLKARAIENLACVVGVNRIGEDGNGQAYSGDSAIINAQGQMLADPGCAAGVHTATLSAADFNHYRQRFPAYLDADDFTLSDA